MRDFGAGGHCCASFLQANSLLKHYSKKLDRPVTSCSTRLFRPANIIFGPFYSFFSLTCMIHVKYYITHPTRFTLRLGLNSSWHRHQKVGSLRPLRREKKGEQTGVGRVKKACVKANSLLVSFCVISCTVGHCCTHCIYSKAQCHTPLWKRALRNIVSTLSSSALSVPLLASFSHSFLFYFCNSHFFKF